MNYGVIVFLTDQTVRPAELGRAVEDRGFESIWIGEHSHIPVATRSPWPGGPVYPESYRRFVDAFVSLSAMAGVTSRLKLGTCITLVPARDPIILAKQVASLDYVSKGRVLFGIGGGWNLEEIANHGIDPVQRWKVMRERILAMKEIWTKDAAEYHGKSVNFDPIWSWPKSVQKPHPPILVAGEGEYALRRVVDYGDGWMPILGRSSGPIEASIRRLNELAEAAGRDSIPISVVRVPPDPAGIERMRAAGVSRAVFGLNVGPNLDATLSHLDQLAKLIEG